MMRRQLELRKEETKTLHQYALLYATLLVLLIQSLRKCDALSAKLDELRASMKLIVPDTQPVSGNTLPLSNFISFF